MKATIEIEIPDGCEIQKVSHRSGGISNGLLVYHVLIKKAWQWPAWLKARYIIMDQDGCWFASDFRPIFITTPTREYWSCTDAKCVTLALTTFEPPPCDNWRMSLRENPNLEES